MSVEKIPVKNIDKVEILWERYGCNGELVIREVLSKPTAPLVGSAPRAGRNGRRATALPGFSTAARDELGKSFWVWTYFSEAEGYQFKRKLESLLRSSGELNPCPFKYGWIDYLPLAIFFLCVFLLAFSEEWGGERIDGGMLKNENSEDQSENAQAGIDEIKELETAGDGAGAEATADEPFVAELDDVQMERSFGTHRRQCVVCGRDSNSLRRAFFSFCRTIGDTDDAEVWIFRGGFGVHVCDKCWRRANGWSTFASKGCFVLCLALLGFAFANLENSSRYFLLLALAFGIPAIVYLVYGVVMAAVWRDRLQSSTDQRFSILQAHGYELDVGRYLREVEDRGDAQGLFGSRRRDDTESFREDVKRRNHDGRWVEHQVYEWLGDFDQADDAGDFSFGLEATKRLAKESEHTKNAIGWRETKI